MHWTSLRKLFSGVMPETASSVVRTLQGQSLKLDFALIAIQLRVQVLEADLGQPASVLQMHGDNPFIWVNSGASDHVKRYAAAHELGHLLLHDISSQNDDGVIYRDIDFGTSLPVERQADRFAMHLLVPQFELDNLILQGLRNSDKLSEIFDVSSNLMRKRIVESW